jgi:hypothetical protein
MADTAHITIEGGRGATDSKVFAMNIDLNSISFMTAGERIPLPPTFDYDGYLDSEQELDMLFPEVNGRRANFIQIGLTAAIYAEEPETGEPLAADETYFLMPDRDSAGVCMRPIRMRPVRRMTLGDYRMAHLTAIKLIGKLNDIGKAMHEVGTAILGDEVISEAESAGA